MTKNKKPFLKHQKGKLELWQNYKRKKAM